MPSTYTPIAAQTLNSNVASVTFSSIPSTYTDLVLISNLGHLTTDQGTLIQFNGDSGTNYSLTNMYGNGSSAASARGTSRSTLPITYYVVPNDSYDHNVTVNIMNYSNNTTYKTLLSRSNRASANNYPGAEAIVGLWRSTAVISSIVITTSSGNIKSGSTFTLYGIKAA